MSSKRILALFKREIRDILRDKKTLVMMLVVPLLLYPLLIVGMALIMNAVVTSQEEKTYLVAFEKETGFEDAICTILEEQEEEIGYRLEVVSEKDCEKALEEEKIDAFIRQNTDGSISLCYLSAKDRSGTAMNALEDAFAIYREQLREEGIRKAGLDVEAILEPIRYEAQDMSTAEESIGNIIGSMMPFLIITVILLGALYPAIDVTAGEKERGTLETLLTLPVTNFEMIMSKFLAVSCIACCSAILNVFSMAGAMAFLVTSSLSSAAELDMTIRFETFIPGILFTIVVMMFFALLVTAVCMCTCVFAKNFKEANNYVTPVMLIFMFGGYAAMIPDLELTTRTAAIPIINVALLVEGLFRFHYDYGLFAMVLFSNVAYSLLAIMVLARIYNSEAVLFSEGFGGVKLFTRRSEMKKNQMPGFGDVVLLLCIVLLSMFYLGTYAQLKWGFGGVAFQQAIILIMPLLYVWYTKIDYKKLFSMKKPNIPQVGGALCIGVAAFLGATIVGALLMPVFPESAKGLETLDEMLAGQPTALLILVIALMPAVGEELLFRGFVMGTLREKCKPWVTVLVTTLIFAAYHMSLIKMFTIGIVGLALTFAAYRSGSIYVSMTVHFLNNLLSVLISAYPDQLRQIAPVLFEESIGTAQLCMLAVIAVILAAAGVWLLGRGGGSRKHTAL